MLMEPYKVPRRVIPAKVGIYNQLKKLDFRLLWNDNQEQLSTFYETANVELPIYIASVNFRF